MSALVWACAPPVEPDPPEPEPCVYPTPSEPFAGIGDVIPPLKWRGYEDHQRIDVDLEQFYCGEQWPEFHSILFVLVAEWCPECPEYSSYVGTLDEQLQFNGTKIVFVDMETRDFELPTSESADNYESQHTEAGVRVGEADGDPAGFITNSEDAGLWSATPNAFFIRKSDMKLVVRQQDGTLLLPFVSIAQGIDLDWSNPDTPRFVSTCEEGGDEDTEPNDLIADATVLHVGDVIEGGICNPEPDYFTVDEAGTWRIDLEFPHLRANLDLLQVDAEGEIMRLPNGVPLGSFTTTDNELMIGNGPQNVIVTSVNERSTPYTLRVRAVQ